MSPANRARLFALSEREFKQHAGPGKPVIPARGKFTAATRGVRLAVEPGNVHRPGLERRTRPQTGLLQ